MGYLFTSDYNRSIQPLELAQITSGDINVRLQQEQTVEAEIRAYLVQRYDFEDEFRSLAAYTPANTYKAGDRVYLDAVPFSATVNYSAGNLVLQSGKVYVANTSISAGAFNASQWTLLGNQNQIFYAKYPSEKIDTSKFYRAGDKVFYKNKEYTALRDSSTLSHEQQLQYDTIENVNFRNPMPDEYRQSLWNSGTSYSVAAGVLVTDTTKWVSGDNRNQLMIGIYIDMVIYNLCKRIAPNNVPEARHNAWLNAKDLLKKFANENLTAELPKIQPKQGATIRYGGDVKRKNNW